MKKPRSGSLILNAIRCQNIKNRNIDASSKNNTNNNKNNRRSFYELSLSLILLLWCLVLLFYSRLGLSHENEGNLTLVNRSISGPDVFKHKVCNETVSHIAERSYNNTNGVLLELNLSSSCDNSTVHINIENQKYSISETNRIEEIIWSFIGYRSLVCKAERLDGWEPGKSKELPGGRTHHSTYLNLDEFRNITRQEKGQQVSSQLVNITHRLEPDGKEYNFASAMKGAKVVAHNKEAKGADNILGKDQDKYLRNPCSVGGTFVVIELSEETLVDVVKIGNSEHYSSNFKDFNLSGSLNYPTETWTQLGNFVAANVKQSQSFKLPEPKWVRYLKLDVISHYGSEFYCTLSVVEVYGVDAIERMLEDLFVSSGETSPNKLPKPDATATPPLRPELGPTDEKRNGKVQNGADSATTGSEKIDDSQQLHATTMKDTVTISKIPDPIPEVRQQPISRMPGDAVLKILLQKDKGLLALESWKATVTSRMDALVRENIMLRLDVEKVVNDQANLESKELAVLAVSLFFICFATIKLVSARVMKFLGSSESDKVRRTSRGWVMILISSTMTIFITLLSS
ncbi:hypothetical protein MANES_02G008500v8 [Manihot esculenta]|uniref:Uncharacterized protein n=1 Tax=Manihot esculenta TaxID=3983 RepID=A0ACB7I2Q8_MANES|nr:hypothetical protein MANES_02G008500v8 [Manihot esculenta]